ncbi:MAG: SRPBCC family protein [Flavobacteriaceae bacterium]|nr:SRPBCC family protein [Flavobacteriaceae bacterium]
MKYSNEKIINRSRQEVVEKIDNTNNMKHWQRGLITAEQLSDTQWKEEAKMTLKYEMEERKLEMIETITKSNFAYEFHTTYKAKRVFNLQENNFKIIDENRTKWVSNSEFKFDSFGIKLMRSLMSGAFKK